MFSRSIDLHVRDQSLTLHKRRDCLTQHCLRCQNDGRFAVGQAPDPFVSIKASGALEVKILDGPGVDP